MSSTARKSKRNSARNNKSTRPKKTSRRLPPQVDLSESLQIMAEELRKRSSRVKRVADVASREKISILARILAFFRP